MWLVTTILNNTYVGYWNYLMFSFTNTFEMEKKVTALTKALNID